MCGIAGFVDPPGQVRPRSQAQAILERMTRTLFRRGPDGQGFWIGGPAALGHRRLAIIDRAGGTQPMTNETGSLVVTYNGELYNELDLKPGLIQRGHRFATACDTETLLHLFEEEDIEFVRKLNGMYALALWDAPTQRLILARDPMGQKPLYWTLTPYGSFVFGSEPKALFEHPEVAREIDPDGLARYLVYEYLPAPFSIWRGLNKLPRASVLVWHWNARPDGPPCRPVITTLSGPPIQPARQHEAGRTPCDPSELRQRLITAAARHCRADVPVGVFLSGGVDSSSVAASVVDSGVFGRPDAVRTFSIGFDDPSFDERLHARAVAKALGTTHHERIFTAADLAALVPEVVNWLDEPFGDASILPTHLLCRFAREEVTVALGGDGADELMGGYPTFDAEPVARQFGRLPRPLRRLIQAGGAALPTRHTNFSFDFKVKRFLRGAIEPLPIPLRHQRWLGSFDGPELLDLLVNPPAVDVEAELVARGEALVGSSAWSEDPEAALLAWYQENYLAEDILFKVDRASMAVGLEVRAPFLDAEVLGWVQAIPAHFKRGKATLKRAMAGRLPRTILERPKKGFGLPVARWLREPGPLSDLADNLLSNQAIARRGWFRPDAVQRLLSEHRAGRADHRKPLWTLLALQLWANRWLPD
ncbi:asparagine synthase (glutamine-hydrolyzing) [Isosphaera pallida ATCC 43644]|uniref:asparagine synthase (glutamine-hydrolyzing) n=1 Tax=Isosphaera pallida (strain ATCC 43644 / DSM 9630 / IS1B) TaxID=575540 RepID=E8R3L8_ISOPI|nr:asparagine synthase (glutamine-hydrolyzing) [Isosphaera pallida]ADV61585.1 asparagine synthase (glutamine-hydrolyzing) [Isosphaera pallida ATCC 43644]